MNAQHKKEIETMITQHKKEMESMKQIQTDIQEIKNSIESMQSRLRESEDRISDIEDRIVVKDHENRDFLKIVRDHEKSIQQLLDDAKKSNIRFIGVHEKTGESTIDIKNCSQK